MNNRRFDRMEKRALLVTRAELDRARVMLAVREIRAIAAPGSHAERASRYRPVATMLMAVLGPAVGTPRLAGWLRIAWVALTALRIARSWR